VHNTLLPPPPFKAPNLHGKEPALAVASVPAVAAVGRRGFAVSLSLKREGKVFDMQVCV
jgi:hypothetical protein